MIHGTLPIQQFQYYVIQDALYLKEFAFCLRYLSVHKATHANPIIQQRLLEFAIGAEEAELSLHNSFFKEWNIIDPTTAATSSTTTTASTMLIHEQMPNALLYTSYMKIVVTTHPYEEGLAVFLQQQQQQRRRRPRIVMIVVQVVVRTPICNNISSCVVIWNTFFGIKH